MIDVYALKNYIISNPELIELVLEKTGFHNIRDNKFNNEYRCSREEGTNPTSVRVKKDTLSAVCFSTNLNGDLITLVQNKLYLPFPKVVKTIAQIVGFVDEENYQDYTLPFGGFYKKIERLSENQIIPLKTYSEEIFNRFKLIPNKMFLEDGITVEVQEKFKVGYDSITMRITVPWYSPDGNLIGIMGRLNIREVDENEAKWFPIISFPKSQVIYGYSENYKSIVEKGVVIVGESEKHTMGLASKGIDVGLSLGGSMMTETQSNLIKSLFPKTIIVALDEGLEESHSREIALRLKSDRFYKNRVGYLYDKNNIILPKGSKLAPADLDKKTLRQLMKHCLIWV